MKKYRKKSYISAFSGGGLLLLCSLSLLSVGFSTWFGGIGEAKNASVSLEVGSVQEVGDYIAYDEDPVSLPELCEDGVVDRENEMIGQTCDVVLGFTLDMSNLRTTLKTYYSTDVTDFFVTTFLSTSFNCEALFKTFLTDATLDLTITNSDSSTTMVDGTKSASTSNVTSQSCSSKFAVSDPGSDAVSLYFKITYSFDFQYKFKTDVYPKLTHNALIFSFKAGAEI